MQLGLVRSGLCLRTERAQLPVALFGVDRLKIGGPCQVVADCLLHKNGGLRDPQRRIGQHLFQQHPQDIAARAGWNVQRVHNHNVSVYIIIKPWRIFGGKALVPETDAVERRQMADVAQAIFGVVALNKQREREVVLPHHRDGHAQIPPAAVFRRFLLLVCRKRGGLREYQTAFERLDDASSPPGGRLALNAGTIEIEHPPGHMQIAVLGAQEAQEADRLLNRVRLDHYVVIHQQHMGERFAAGEHLDQAAGEAAAAAKVFVREKAQAFLPRKALRQRPAVVHDENLQLAGQRRGGREERLREEGQVAQNVFLAAVGADHDRQAHRSRGDVCLVAAAGEAAALPERLEAQPETACGGLGGKIEGQGAAVLRGAAREQNVFARTVGPQRDREAACEIQRGGGAGERCPAQKFGAGEGVEIRVQREDAPRGKRAGDGIEAALLHPHIQLLRARHRPAGLDLKKLCDCHRRFAFPSARRSRSLRPAVLLLNLYYVKTIRFVF